VGHSNEGKQDLKPEDFGKDQLGNREAFEEMEESDGERAAGSDTAEERAIRAMPIVTALAYVRAVKDKARGVRVTLTCYNCREYGSCEKPQEAPDLRITNG